MDCSVSLQAQISCSPDDVTLHRCILSIIVFSAVFADAPGRKSSMRAVGGWQRAGAGHGVSGRGASRGAAGRRLRLNKRDRQVSERPTISWRTATESKISVCTPVAALLLFFRWLCRSLVAPSWKVLGRAPNSMVNSGVLSSNRAIKTIWAAWKTHKRCQHNQPRWSEMTSFQKTNNAVPHH